MKLKEEIYSKSKALLRVAAIAALFQGGCISQTDSAPTTSSGVFQKKVFKKMPMPSLTEQEKQQYEHLMQNYATRSLSARKVLQELVEQNISLELFTKEQDKDNLFRAGETGKNSIRLNRLIKEKSVSLEDTFFHEAEHALHLKQATDAGINSCSFSSLNDIYIYVSLMEALAYRKAALCTMEYHRVKAAQKKAMDIFNMRFSAKGKDTDERFNYEKDAIMLINSDTNVLPNQVYFKENPNWNRIASILSRGEVTKIVGLPQPTLTFLNLCLLRELEKHPNAQKLEDLNISCALANRSSLQKDQRAIKEMISNLALEVYAMCQKTKKGFSEQTNDSFLKIIGWPTAQQKAEIERKKTTFQKVRDDNLAHFKTGELFDLMDNLLSSDEIKAYNPPKIEQYRKILKFGKMFLIPNKPSKNVQLKKGKGQSV